MRTTPARRPPERVHRPPTTTTHLHTVLHALDENLVDGRPLRDVDIRNGQVSIETEPADFDAYLAALAEYGLAEPVIERSLAASGALLVTAPVAAYGEIDGARLRLWTLRQVTSEAYWAANPPRAKLPGSARQVTRP